MIFLGRLDDQTVFIDPWQKNKTYCPEQDKAKELSEPEQPAKGLTIRDCGDAVKGNGLCYQERIGSDATGGYDHADAAHCQDAKRVNDSKMAGCADGEKTKPGTQEIEAPDPYRINEEEGFIFYTPDAGEAVPDVDKDVLYLLYDGDVAETFQDPPADEEDDGNNEQKQGDL